MRRYLAETIGAFGFSFLVCGAVLFGGGKLSTTDLALAVGLAAAAMTVAMSAAPGAHFDPIVTLASWAAGRMRIRDVPSLWLAQLAGGVLGTGVAIAGATSRPGGSIEIASSVAAGFGRASPSSSGLGAALVVGATLGALLAVVILGSAALAPPARALAAGFAYAATAFVGLPVANAIPNPATVLGPALFLGGQALDQVWVFLLAPAFGALIVGALSRRHAALGTAPVTSSASSPR